jgi:hypothetical protein
MQKGGINSRPFLLREPGCRRGNLASFAIENG